VFSFAVEMFRRDGGRLEIDFQARVVSYFSPRIRATRNSTR
jgi:hypothetical protein